MRELALAPYLAFLAEGEVRVSSNEGRDAHQDRSSQRVQAEVIDLGPQHEVRVFNIEGEDEHAEGSSDRVGEEVMDRNPQDKVTVSKDEGATIRKLNDNNSLMKWQRFAEMKRLYSAARDGNEEEVMLLLEKEGIEINEGPSSRDGMTPLHAAAKGGHGNVVAHLLEKKGIHVKE